VKLVSLEEATANKLNLFWVIWFGC
jgi:hypothetical protein